MSTNSLVRKRFQAALKQQQLAGTVLNQSSKETSKISNALFLMYIVGGLSGLLLLSTLFKKIDVDKNGYLSWDEVSIEECTINTPWNKQFRFIVCLFHMLYQFCSGLNQCGLTPSPRDIRALFLDLDKDANNKISYNEFIFAMREELSAERKALIAKVFSIVDSDRDGTISMTDIGRIFNPKNHPDVRSGRVTVAKLTSDFFESINTAADGGGYLNIAQFMEYYANTAAFDDDTKFVTQMKAIWNLSTPTIKSTSTYGDTAVGGLFESSTAGDAKNLDVLRDQLSTRGVRGIYTIPHYTILYHTILYYTILYTLCTLYR